MSKCDKIRQKKTNLIEALEKSMGVITTACKKVGIHRSTFYEYVNNHEKENNRLKVMKPI